MKNKVLAVIPARGGSKGLPGKNIKPLHNKPLIAWTIEAAQKASCISKTIVSTDDVSIQEVSNKYHAELPFLRPPHLSTDDTLGVEVILHALEQMPGFDYVFMLQPTSPLRTAEDIDNAFRFFLNSGANACVSVAETVQSPFWSFMLSEQGYLTPLFPKDKFPQRRQDIPPTYFLNGAIYIAKTEWLQQSKSFITDETCAFIMPGTKSIDIDTIEDFEEAEEMLRQIHL